MIIITLINNKLYIMHVIYCILKWKYTTFQERATFAGTNVKVASHWGRSKNTLVKAERVCVSQGIKYKHSCYSGKGSIPLGKKFKCSCYSGK